MNIVLISGSTREGSVNSAVLRTIQQITASLIRAELYSGMSSLPHFNPDVEQHALPESVRELRQMLHEAGAVLFCTPEYAGSLPGSFKNLLDWCVGEGLYDMPVGYINTSAHGGAKGAHDTLRTVLSYVNADVIEGACRDIPVRRDAIDASGYVADPQLRAAFREVALALAGYVERRSRTTMI